MTDATTIPTDKAGEQIAAENADLLLDNIACATQNRAFLRDDEGEDRVLTEAVLDNAKYVILRAIKAAHPQPSLSVGLNREATLAPLRRAPMAAVASLDGTVQQPLVCLLPEEADQILALAAPAEGYVLVPVEPTEAMIEAMDNAVFTHGNVVDAYRSMLSTAPTANAPSGAWRQIESAPKDGRLALVYRPLARLTSDEPVAVKRLIGGDDHCWPRTVPEGQKPCNPTDGACHVTHWMPLPAAPTGGRS